MDSIFFSSFRKSISIEIIDRDQYQRNESFLIRLGEPSLIRDNDDIDESRRCFVAMTISINLFF